MVTIGGLLICRGHEVHFTPHSHYPGLATVFSAWVIELGLALKLFTLLYLT